MRLSKRTEYGIQAIIRLAQLNQKTYIQAKDLATGQEKLPYKFLEAILRALRQGGFLESKVGTGGGYRLTRAPKEISVGELIRHLDGRLSIQDTRNSGDQSPGRIACCLLNDKIAGALEIAIDTMNLEQLIEQVNRVTGQSEMYHI